MGLTPEELGQKIKEAQSRQPPEAAGLKDPAAQENSRALRAGIDFVASLVVGVFLGYWIDRWLGTKPFGVILFLFLGFGAGTLSLDCSQTPAQDSKTDLKDDKDQRLRN